MDKSVDGVSVHRMHHLRARSKRIGPHRASQQREESKRRSGRCQPGKRSPRPPVDFRFLTFVSGMASRSHVYRPAGKRVRIRAVEDEVLRTAL